MGLRSLPQRAGGPPPLERDEARILNQWLDAKRLLWLHVPNERRHRVGGTKKGAPDYLIFDWPPSPILYDKIGAAIELKRDDARSKTSTEQERWLHELAKRHWAVFVAYGADAAIAWMTRLGYGK